MQHLYSLRTHARKATAAMEENPLPMPSVAKSRKFINDNITHAIRTKTGGTMAPAIAKKTAQLVAMEKNLLRSMENVSQERIDNAKQLSAWGEEQEDDISDVSDKLSVLFAQAGDLEDIYVDRYDYYRGALKDIRDIEKSVQPIRDSEQVHGRSDVTKLTVLAGKEKIIEKIAKLKTEEKKEADPNEIPDLENELERVDAELIVAETQLVTITREKFRSGFNYQLDAMRELGEKLSIIAGYGKHLLELVDESPTLPGDEQKPYTSHDASEAIVKECDRALTAWVGSNAAVDTQLSGRVQSMISDTRDNRDNNHNAGGVSSVASRPAGRRRWSSDSDGGGKEVVPANPTSPTSPGGNSTLGSASQANPVSPTSPGGRSMTGSAGQAL